MTSSRMGKRLSKCVPEARLARYRTNFSSHWGSEQVSVRGLNANPVSL